MGYREGLEAGKLSQLQNGFDEGYNEAGMPVGQKVGMLLGESDALYFIYSQQKTLGPGQTAALAELRNLSQELRKIKVDDVAEPDWDALKHELEHHSVGDADSTLAERKAAWKERGDVLAGKRARLEQLRAALE